MRTFGIILLTILIIAVLSAGGAALWAWYEQRPQTLTHLADVELGAPEVDITLRWGQPDLWLDGANYTNGKDAKEFVYQELAYYSFVTTSGTVSLICTDQVSVFGLYKFAPESLVTDKLGEPGAVSINKAGTHKRMIYPQWNVAFEMLGGAVLEVCISENPYRFFYPAERSYAGDG